MSPVRPLARCAVLALSGGLAVSAAWSGSGPGPTVPLADQRIGACHVLATPQEQDAIVDATPEVPCSAPHVAETIAIPTLPPWLSRHATRPSSDALARAVPQLPCTLADVARYLGGDPTTSTPRFEVRVRFPAVDEWQAGERRFRCDVLTAAVDGLRRPRVGSVRGLLGDHG